MAEVAQAEISDEDVYARRVRPRDWINPFPRDRYDLAIVGAGPSGVTAATEAVRLGFSVALIEGDRIGGNSLNAGSVPSKAIVRSARIYTGIGELEAFGVATPNQPTLNIGEVMQRMRHIRTRVAEHLSVEKLQRLGIDVFFGAARFDGPESLRFDETRIVFKKALVATGARPRRANIAGLEEAGYLTSTTIFDVKTLPRRLGVIGGGPLGCELAQAFCRLGSEVTIVQNEPKFLPREERDAAEILSRSMARDGVSIYLNTNVVGARIVGTAKIIDTISDDLKGAIEVDEILLSVGREADMQALALERAGIAFDADKGIQVDDFLRTTNSNVYAAGDVCMEQKFTNAAVATARIAVHNALSGGEERHDQLTIPWCTYCDPEIAHIGLYVQEARRRSIPIKSYAIMMHDVDRAITERAESGYVKIHVREGTDEILGATIVGSRASELINEIAVIMKAGVGLKDLAAVVHTYPSESGAIALAAQAYLRGLQPARTLDAA